MSRGGHDRRDSITSIVAEGEIDSFRANVNINDHIARDYAEEKTKTEEALASPSGRSLLSQRLNFWKNVASTRIDNTKAEPKPATIKQPAVNNNNRPHRATITGPAPIVQGNSVIVLDDSSALNTANPSTGKLSQNRNTNKPIDNTSTTSKASVHPAEEHRKRRYSAPQNEIGSLLSFWKNKEKQKDEKPASAATATSNQNANNSTAKLNNNNNNNNNNNSDNNSSAKSASNGNNSSVAGTPIKKAADTSSLAAPSTTVKSAPSNPLSTNKLPVKWEEVLKLQQEKDSQPHKAISSLQLPGAPNSLASAADKKRAKELELELARQREAEDRRSAEKELRIQRDKEEKAKIKREEERIKERARRDKELAEEAEKNKKIAAESAKRIAQEAKLAAESAPASAPASNPLGLPPILRGKTDLAAAGTDDLAAEDEIVGAPTFRQAPEPSRADSEREIAPAERIEQNQGKNSPKDGVEDFPADKTPRFIKQKTDAELSEEPEEEEINTITILSDEHEQKHGADFVPKALDITIPPSPSTQNMPSASPVTTFTTPFDLNTPSASNLASPSPQSGPEDPEKASRDAAHRVKVLGEIASTEESYVKALHTLVAEFIHPLKSQGDFGVSQADTNKIFGSVELLTNFHQHLLSELQQAKLPVGEILLKFADFLKMYTQYLNNYTEALNTIDKQRSNVKFQAFLTEKRKKCGLDLMSYLIMPVQRVPRYELLLRELIRVTGKDHSEYPKLLEALDKIKNIAAHINETKRLVENMSKLLEIQNQISGDFGTLMVPHRRLIREGVVQKLSTGLISTSANQRKLFVFNDILLWTSMSNKFRGHIELERTNCSEYSDKKRLGFKVAVQNTGEHSQGQSHAENGAEAEKELIFIVNSSAERDQWMADIKEAHDTLQEASQTARNRRQTVVTNIGTIQKETSSTNK
jgi:hypothetical protein